jgi:hypothetical protein
MPRRYASFNIEHQKKLKDFKDKYGKQGLMHLAGRFM